MRLNEQIFCCCALTSADDLTLYFVPAAPFNAQTSIKSAVKGHEARTLNVVL